MNKIIGIAVGLAVGYVAEKFTEEVVARLGFDPKIVRVAGAVVGALVS